MFLFPDLFRVLLNFMRSWGSILSFLSFESYRNYRRLIINSCRTGRLIFKKKKAHKLSNTLLAIFHHFVLNSITMYMYNIYNKTGIIIIFILHYIRQQNIIYYTLQDNETRPGLTFKQKCSNWNYNKHIL
jgi:hypothetical protein